MSSAKVFVPRTTESLLGVKRALRAALGAPSSHLTEAIAAALGHGTHASLLAEISRQPAAPLVALDDAAFARRLETLSGIHVDATRGPGLFHELEYPPNTGEVRTWSSKFAAIKYKSTKERAWRNMMVAGINAGIEQRLFSVRPGSNAWPGADTTMSNGWVPSFKYEFAIEGIPAIAQVQDVGFDELGFKVIFWPTALAKEWMAHDRFRTGDAYAYGWLERRDAAYLMFSAAPINCRRSRIATIAAMTIDPLAYADRGNFRM